MSQRGVFPIEAIVHVDPDFFKLEMPEWKGNGKYKGYFERGQTSVDSLCGVEARYMANLAQEIALERGQNQGQKTIPNQGSRALLIQENLFRPVLGCIESDFLLPSIRFATL